MTDEQIYEVIAPFYAECNIARAAADVSMDEYRAIEAAATAPLLAEIERMQKALAFWMPDVPPEDHPLYKRVANDLYLLVGCDGPNPEPSAFELGHVALAASPNPKD